MKQQNTLITYYQLPMQQQFHVNLEKIQDKAYKQFFSEDLTVPVEMLKAQRQSPLQAQSLFEPTVEGINAYLQNPYQLPLSAFGVLNNENGLVAAISSRHFMPNVTTEMMEWWFTWHCNQEPERYSLWFPHAHISNTVKYPERLTDPSLSYAQKLYGNPNYVQEYLGESILDCTINFHAPEELGISPETLKQGNYTFSASGWSQTKDSPFPGGLMLHLGREKEGGFELISHYWIGVHKEWSRVSGIDGIGEQAVAAVEPQRENVAHEMSKIAYEMSVHDMTEFTRLGQFLPALFEQFGNE